MQDFIDLLKDGQILSRPPSLTTILFSLCGAVVLSLPIALIYMKTRSREGYTQSFVQALILISITVATVMLIIGNNIARAFGLIGAVAIIRFRTKVKDPKDTTFLFLCIAIGMACGLRLYYIGILATAFISGILLSLWKINFGKREEDSQNGILRIKMKDIDSGKELLTKYFEEEVAKWEMVGMNSEKQDIVTIEYGIRFKEDTTPDHLVHELRKAGTGNFISIEYRKPK